MVAKTQTVEGAASSHHDVVTQTRTFGPSSHLVKVLRSLFPQKSKQRQAALPQVKSLPILAEQPLGLICFSLIAVAFWILTHAYQGIIGDASVYIGRALADLDPGGVGRDMVFVHDGQSRFSIIPLLLDRLVASFGTNATGILLTFSAMAAWVAALAAFANRYVPKPFVAIVVIFVALLPTSYGAPLRFHFSQALAVPRPLAEALVLAALAALAAGRTWLGFAVLLLASLVHPLMALAGWGVFAIVLSYEDRRWAAAFVGVAALAIAGGAIGLPLLHRLFVVMAPDLKALAVSRSPHLFPTLWPIEFIGPILAEAASLLIAASFFTGRRRLILVAVLLAGIGGIAAQAIFADYFSLLLVIQAQLWRMAWITAAIGGAALAFCTLTFWRDGPLSHTALALLVLAWLSAGEPLAAGAFACTAIAVHFYGRRVKLPLTWMAAALCWGVACIVAIGVNAHYFAGYTHFMAGLPEVLPGSHYFWVDRCVAFPILAAVLFLSFSQKSRAAAPILVVITLSLCALAFRFWDDRRPFQKMIDAGKQPPQLMQVIAKRPGAVLWLDGMSEAWYLTGRAQWATPEQGIATIFSPALAREWQSRMEFLVHERLAEKQVLKDYSSSSAADMPYLTHDNIIHLCTRPDAPAWVIAPVYKDTIIPPGFETHEWHLPQPNFKMTDEQSFYAWHRIDAYAILACAGSKRS